MKKITSILLCAIMILTMVGMAMPANASQRITTPADFDMSGVSLTKGEFQSTYSGDPATRETTSRSGLSTSVNLALDNILIQERNISLDLQLLTANETVFIPVKGVLSAGFRTQNGINSIIVEVQNTKQDYNILLFEIYNDTIVDELLIVNKDQYAAVPHVKIYIQDDENNIYLLESAMPEFFCNLDASKYPLADKNNDALWWARDLVERQRKILPTDHVIRNQLGLDSLSRGLNSTSTWTDSTTYYDSFYISSSFVQCWSLPYVEYKHTNVSSATSTWFARFKVAEHIEIDGVTYYGNNAYQYRNIKISFGAGDNTIFLRTLQQGRFTDSNALTNNLVTNGARIAVNLLKYTAERTGNSTFATVLDIVSNMSISSGNVYLGSEGMNLMNDNATAVGEQLKTRYVFEEATNQPSGSGIGDYFILQADVQYEGSGSCSTTGVLAFSYDVEYDLELTSKGAEIALSYSAAP